MGMSCKAIRQLVQGDPVMLAAVDAGVKHRASVAKNPDGMNRTERRFADILKAMVLYEDILDWEFEPEKLRLADKTWFRPDFRIVLTNYQVGFVEVKGGFIREDAICKLKVIAEIQPYPFFLAIYKANRWEIRRMPSRKWGHIPCNINWTI